MPLLFLEWSPNVVCRNHGVVFGVSVIAINYHPRRSATVSLEEKRCQVGKKKRTEDDYDGDGVLDYAQSTTSTF